MKMKMTLFVLFCMLCASVCDAIAEDLTIYPGLDITFQPGERMSVLVHQGQMIYVTNRAGSALIDFTFNERGANYRFKASDGISKVITSTGSGEVFEEYSRTLRADGGFDVKDKGGQLMIKAGVFELEWSRGSSKSGFVYFDPSQVKVFVLSSSYFDRIRLTHTIEP